MNRPLLLILALCALLGVGYAWATPIGAAPDERAHLEYVRVLATERRLPVLNLEQRRQDAAGDIGYEAHQPPAYYVLAVPFYLAGQSVAGEAGAAQGCRVLSILLGLAGTAGVWLLAREVAPARPALWAAAAAVAAFLPMRLAVLASVSNDALAEASSSLALWMMVRPLAPGRAAATTRDAVRLGGALALALLAKQSAIVLLPPALLALYLWTRPAPLLKPAAGTPGSARRTVRGQNPAAPAAEPDVRLFLVSGLIVGAVLLILAGWWYLRNHLVYGDPLGLRAFNWYFADTTRWADFRDNPRLRWSYGQYFGLVLRTTGATFWGAFGHLDRPELFMGALGRGYPPPSWVYPILNWGAALALAGGVRYFLRRRGAEDAGNARLGVLALHALFVAASFLNFNSTYFQAQGRYLFPAVGALALGLAGGWLEWGRRRETAVAWGIGGGFFVLALYALFAVLAPAFATSTY